MCQLLGRVEQASRYRTPLVSELGSPPKHHSLCVLTIPQPLDDVLGQCPVGQLGRAGPIARYCQRSNVGTLFRCISLGRVGKAWSYLSLAWLVFFSSLRLPQKDSVMGAWTTSRVLLFVLVLALMMGIPFFDWRAPKSKTTDDAQLPSRRRWLWAGATLVVVIVYVLLYSD